MDDPRTGFFANFDWKSFEQFFGGRLPSIPNDKRNDLAWVEQYVQDVMKQAFPPAIHTSVFEKHYRTEVFDTHNNVVIKVHIPDRLQARNVRTLVGINRVKLEGLPEDGHQTIPLNAHVIPESCKAVYKNGVLQLHIRKITLNDRLREVNVRFHD